jgi:hypothetical protein
MPVFQDVVDRQTWGRHDAIALFFDRVNGVDHCDVPALR